MYLTKGKKGRNLYNSYNPQYLKHQEMETSVHVAKTVARDISGSMSTCVRHISAIVVRDLRRKGKK